MVTNWGRIWENPLSEKGYVGLNHLKIIVLIDIFTDLA